MKIAKSVLAKNVFMFSLTFFVGAVIAGSAFYINRLSVTGRGGLETPSMPFYAEADVSESTVAHESSQIDLSTGGFNYDALLEEQRANEGEYDPLTYQTYRIRKGDMIGFIASAYGVSQDTLISMNNIRATRLIQPGQYIKIPSMTGILYTVKKDGETPETISEKYNVNAEKCAFVNKKSATDSLAAGSTIFVPDAELDWVTRQEINGDLFRRPIHGWYRVSSYFGWRPSPFSGKRSWHGGIDMACPQWTKIYAALSGTVIKVAYSNTYGNYVIIQHHSGYQTLYGHMVQQNAKVGQHVTADTVIGYVGSTGQSTGPHCHFTIFKNGKMINPINLWG